MFSIGTGEKKFEGRGQWAAKGVGDTKAKIGMRVTTSQGSFIGAVVLCEDN